jgi:hypothetical protein
VEREGKVIFSFVQHNLNDIGMFVRFNKKVFAACFIDDTASKYPIQHLVAIACFFAFVNIFIQNKSSLLQNIAKARLGTERSHKDPPPPPSSIS